MLDRIENAIRKLLGSGLFFTVVLKFANVIGRYVFEDSMLGADGVRAMAAMTLLGTADICPSSANAAIGYITKENKVLKLESLSTNILQYPTFHTIIFTSGAQWCG
jgi:hypothetical protein